jgi:hypothetical protein
MYNLWIYKIILGHFCKYICGFIESEVKHKFKIIKIFIYIPIYQNNFIMKHFIIY